MLLNVLHETVEPVHTFSVHNLFC